MAEKWEDIEEDLTGQVDIQGNPVSSLNTSSDQKWVDVKEGEAPEEKKVPYIPENLKGTSYEGMVDDVRDLLIGQKEKGFDQAVRLDKGSIAWALETFKGINPDQAAKVQKLATDKAIPFDVIKNNPEAWKEWEEANKIYESLYSTVETENGRQWKYPYTANWLKDPVKMAQAKDDIEALTQLEGAMIAYRAPMYKYLGAKLKGGAQRILRDVIFSNAQAIQELLTEQVDDIAAGTLGYLKETAYKVAPGFDKMFQLEQDIAEEAKGALKGKFEDIRHSELLTPTPIPKVAGLKGFTGDFIEMVPQLAGTIGAASISGPVGGGAFMGSYIFGSTYGELADKGVDVDRAAVAAFGNASIQAALEVYGLNKLMGMFRATGGKQIAIEFFKTLAAESGTEFLQAFPEEAARIWGEAEIEGQDLNEQLATFVERLPETAKQGIYEGLVVMPVALIGGSAKVAHDYARYRQSGVDVSFWENYMELAEKSKLKERSPEEFENFLSDVAAKSGSDVPKVVYLDVEAVKTFFQGDSESMGAFFKELGITDQAAEADITGKELEINAAKLAAKYAGTDVEKGLRSYLRFNIDGMTANEQKTIKEETTKNLADLQREYQEYVADNALPPQAVKMRDQLMLPKDQGGFGMKAEDADAQMALFMAGGRVLSAKRGESLQQWFDRVAPSLEIGGEFKDVGADVLKQAETTSLSVLKGIIKETIDQGVMSDKGIKKAVTVAGQREGLKGTEINLVVNELLKYNEGKKVGEGVTYNQEGAINRDENFKKWFDDSKVVGKKGEPLKVFHGTSADFDVFNQEHKESVQLKGSGFYFTTDAEVASKFANRPNRQGGNIKEAYVSLQNPAEVTLDEMFKLLEDFGFGEGLTNHLKGLGHDGVVLLNNKGGIDQVIAYEPTQIKSVNNLGTFDPTDPNILRQGERGAVKFTPSKTIISLFKEADMSTFLHETGHVFTNEMKKMIDAGLGDEQLQKDYDTLLTFAGGKFDVAGQEKVARGFEAYLREGKAPSVKLSNAFGRFKAWLTSVYRTVRNLGVEIDDNVRQVFDRILASEAEVKEAQEYYKARRNLADLIPVTKKQKEKLEKAKDKADKSAEARQLKKYMKAYLDANGGKQVLRDQATKEVEALPVYKAMYDAIENGSIDSNTLTKAQVKELKAKHGKLVKKKGKFTLDQLAAKYEYASADELMQALTAADKKSEAITKRTAELLLQAEDRIRQDLQKEENVPGEEALHNDASLEYLIAEAEVLSEKLNKKKEQRPQILEAKAYRDAAKDVVGRKQVKDAIRYDLYAKSEQRWAKEAYDKAQDGDLVAAHDAKKKQILNHALVQEAIRARDEKQAIENRYKATKIKPKLKASEEAYANVAADLIQAYRLSTSPSIAPTTENAVAGLKELDEVLYRQTPTWVIEKVKPEGFQTYKDLTTDQLRELDESIRSVLHYGRDELRALEDERLKTVETFVAASVDDMSKLKDKQVYDEFNTVGKFLNKIDGLINATSMMEFVFERFDNYALTKTHHFGPMRKMFNRGVKAETDFAQIKQTAYDHAEKHWDTIYRAKQRIEKKHGGQKFTLSNLPMIEEMVNVGRGNWTVERMVAFVLNTGNQGNLQALKNSYGYSDQQVNELVAEFTVDELQAIQGIWDVTNGLYPGLNETNFNVYNRHLPKVEAAKQTWNTADGVTVELEGGYYPLQFDHQLSDRVGQQQEEDLMKNRATSVFRTTKPADGFTNSRVEGHSLPPELNLGVWFTHIADTARFISHAAYMRDLNRVTQNPEWRKSARAKGGRDLYTKIRDWVQFQARPDRRVKGSWEKVLEGQRKLATIAILGANTAVGVKQRLSMFSAAKEIGWKWIYEGYKDNDMKNSVLGLRNSEKWKKIISKSAYIKTRVGSIDRELQDVRGKMSPFVKRFNLYGKEFTWKDVQDFMFEWIQMNDRATVGVAWSGAYNKFLAEDYDNSVSEEKNEADAITYADRIVATTQPSALPIDLNSLQRSEGTMRMFTSFMTWTFKFGNRLHAQNKAYRDGAIDSKEYFRHVLYEVFMSPWGAAIISSLWVSGEIPEWWEWLTAPAENTVSWVPFLRDIPGYYKYRSPVGGSIAFEGVNRSVQAGMTAWGFLEGDKEFAQLAWDIGRAVEVQAGVPALRVVRDMTRAYNNIAEERK